MATGLDMVGARAYDPSAGRFISRDPDLEKTDPNQYGGYTYAGGNPVDGSDPTGLLGPIIITPPPAPAGGVAGPTVPTPRKDPVIPRTSSSGGGGCDAYCQAQKFITSATSKGNDNVQTWQVGKAQATAS